MIANPSRQRGIFHRARVRLFGERDPVADQLRDMARQGTVMARIAHGFAFLLIVLFSAGSLVALAGEAFSRSLASWQAGRVDIPSTISVAVSTLLVPCMDAAMLYAANMLRLLAARRADAREQRVHRLVVAGVAILEAATYVYMAAQYEHPATLAAWALIIGRALGAPLIGVYLSMARPLPVTARDILYNVELAAGGGVLRDVTELAHNPRQDLLDKMALYNASAVMAEPDRERLGGMVAEVARQRGRALAELRDGPRASIAELAAASAIQPTWPPGTHAPMPRPVIGPRGYHAEHVPDSDGGSADDMQNDAEDGEYSGSAPSADGLQSGDGRGGSARRVQNAERERMKERAYEEWARRIVQQMVDEDPEVSYNALANATGLSWRAAKRMKDAYLSRRTRGWAEAWEDGTPSDPGADDADSGPIAMAQ